MLDLTGHMIIWGGLFAHGDGSTGLMKVVFCYALPTVVWSEHIVPVYLACQITIKKVQVQLRVNGKNNPRQLHPIPKSSCAKMWLSCNEVFRWRRTIYLQQEAVQTIPWPTISPDMNPIEHVWDFIGRKINQRNPKCQNTDK
jgi:hypothetical protein